MESRESRYWLRIESGARQGEKVPLGVAPLTLGRRSENQIVLADGSVSGQHAEIRPDGAELVLVDLGSTNGTKVGGARIEAHRLAHGDRFVLGSVELTFLDAQLGEAPASDSSAQEEVGRIDAGRVAPSSRRGILLLALVVVVGGAVGTWKLLGSGEDGPAVRSVSEVPGNLVADGTFEAGADGPEWTSAATAPQSFYRDLGFAATGGTGMGVALEAGEWAMASSPSFSLGSRDSLAVRADLAAEGGARARLGVRFESSSGGGQPFVAWSRIVESAGGEFTEATLSVGGLPGYDRASVVLAAVASAGGAVSADDVSAVPADAPVTAAAKFNEFEARLFGPGSTTAAFVRSGHVPFAGIDFAPWTETARSGGTGVRWSASATANGLDFTGTNVPADAVFRLVAQPRTDGGEGEKIHLAAVGASGYRSLANEFEVEQAESLLVGRGVDLLRLWFDQPVRITGVTREGALHLRVATGGLAGFHLQLTFAEERNRARELAGDARDLELRGEPGAALDAWTRLLDEVPFEASLVAQAEDARARLVQGGMEEVEEIRREVERARFFALPELYRQCRARAIEVGDRFGSSEVATEASVLVGEIDVELSTLEETAPDTAREKLLAVLAAIREDEAPDLAAHIREVLGAAGDQEEDGD